MLGCWGSKVYYSERVRGETPRDLEVIGEDAWVSLATLVRVLIEDGSFGNSYPKVGTLSGGTIGTDEQAFWQRLIIAVPKLHDTMVFQNRFKDPKLSVPDTLNVLDMLEFCWKKVAHPARAGQHGIEYLLQFDVGRGRESFRAEVNQVFSRHRLAYELSPQGRIERRLVPALGEVITDVRSFHTNDAELDRLLEMAVTKFLDPDYEKQREALEPLWDAWERLKTLDSPGAKKEGIANLLNSAAGKESPEFRTVLEGEAGCLTTVGNRFSIRHSETDQIPLASRHHVDYLFYRLLALIHLILRMRSD